MFEREKENEKREKSDKLGALYDLNMMGNCFFSHECYG
jgi:hypothetical protein